MKTEIEFLEEVYHELDLCFRLTPTAYASMAGRRARITPLIVFRSMNFLLVRFVVSQFWVDFQMLRQ